LFEEGLKIQRSRLNDLRRYARDRRAEQQIRQRNEIASLENYYKDQFAMLAETLQSEKNDLKTRNDAQAKVSLKKHHFQYILHAWFAFSLPTNSP